jgi:transposase-like protein
VVQEVYVHGVSTRAVDSLAETLGLKVWGSKITSRFAAQLVRQVSDR